MNYGEVKAGLTPEEFARLKGKKVVMWDLFSDILKMPESCAKGTFVDYDSLNRKPFDVEQHGIIGSFVFIREILENELESEPKYRPFTFEEAQTHLGEIILSNNGLSAKIIGSIHKADGYVQICGFTAETLCENWHFDNGTPCGVKE